MVNGIFDWYIKARDRGCYIEMVPFEKDSRLRRLGAILLNIVEMDCFAARFIQALNMQMYSENPSR